MHPERRDLFIIAAAIVPLICGFFLFLNWANSGEPTPNFSLPNVNVTTPGVHVAVPKEVSRTSQSFTDKLAQVSREPLDQKAMLAAAVLMVGIAALIILWLIMDMLGRWRRSLRKGKEPAVPQARWRAPS